MARTAVLGLPRVGPDRELKFSLEAFWAEKTGEEELLETARALRSANWKRAHAAGIDVIPCGDFSLYDHVLDTAWALGATPSRFGELNRGSLSDYFALARGTAEQRPLEMTKWFDTNYHYLVPELEPRQRFELCADHWSGPLREAAALGIATRPVVLGPVSFLLLSKGLEQPLKLLDDLVPVYAQLLSELSTAGATEVQVDEPYLAVDRNGAELEAFAGAWRKLADASAADLSLATYFVGLDPVALDLIAELAPAELHLDLVRAPEQLAQALATLREGPTRLSLGVLDGRNIWVADPDRALDWIDAASAALGDERITIAPSCSLLHVPYEAAREEGIDPEIRPWLAFCTEKLAELKMLRAAVDRPAERSELLAAARATISARRTSTHTNDPTVRKRVGTLGPSDYARPAPFEVRRPLQADRLGLPELPTTTIGSYPQTDAIRTARRELREGKLDEGAYLEFIRGQIDEVVAFQEEIGLDVLVHGEPERNDMVEHFGQQLAGFTFSANGWVQSYGSRCVKPPILFGDVSRPRAMTVEWWRYAQSRTDKPMKGMLTGPVTILQWSFVRDDQPRSETCIQIALAIQDEVRDLEAAGAAAIQVDEAALREGLPLRLAKRVAYVRWAIDCFRLATAPARAETQIHTHMCYSEFNDMIEDIVRLDADVISIEASRSGMEVLDAFTDGVAYPNEVGPGVYDIHSPRVPSIEEIEELLELAERRVGRDRLWVNPDCGLKTRGWEEVRPALANLAAAARRRRAAAAIDR
ncbi:MAG TPA: 5-methyltetrahydropteroyltriglutamate--homocysteine S-methyltransferase [Solirubrobacterales bacterium]|nr:5-methyltetrahydropteroyltriglutamate--homocysteine S-methyltransferase [Solirubrobacterales bacterium]